MSILQKLKQVFASQADGNQKTTQDRKKLPPTPRAVKQNKDNNDTEAFDIDSTTHQYPITKRFIDWINKNDWHFVHHTPDVLDKLACHHIVIGFASGDDGGVDWNCIVRISEKNQLVTMHGILTDELDKAYFLDALAMFANANAVTNFGEIGLDLRTGSVRVKLSFDAEFTQLSWLMLESYMQALATLVETAYKIIQTVSVNPTPSQTLDALLATYQIDLTDTTEEDKPYYAPTHTYQ